MIKYVRAVGIEYFRRKHHNMHIRGYILCTLHLYYENEFVTVYYAKYYCKNPIKKLK